MTEPHHRAPDWRPQLAWLALIALLGTLPFWLWDLDIRLASSFYHSEADNPWYEGGRPLWYFLYLAGPLLMGLVVLGSLLVVAGGRFWARMCRVRPYALLVLASALLGPGLLVNGIFKETWGRPRPHQVEALGGTQQYLPPLEMGERGKGKSFPSGHSSVGFMLGVFFLIWRRRRPWLAWMALVGAIGLGTLMGVGRMAAGDHFLSDVIWSGVMSYGIVLLTYFALLRIPRREAEAAARPVTVPEPPVHPLLTAGAYGAAALVLLAGVLLLMPVHEDHRDLVTVADLGPGPHVLTIRADMANVILYAMEGDDPALIRLGIRGFGIPGSRVDHGASIDDGRLTYSIRHKGIFSERDTKLVVGLVSDQWERVEVEVGSGDIRVMGLNAGRPELEIESADGDLIRE